MKDKLKVHPIDVPRDIIAWFFTRSHQLHVRVELVEVVGFNSLRVDLVYRKHQREKVMQLIEGVDRYLWEEQERQIQEL